MLPAGTFNTALPRLTSTFQGIGTGCVGDFWSHRHCVSGRWGNQVIGQSDFVASGAGGIPNIISSDPTVGGYPSINFDGVGNRMDSESNFVLGAFTIIFGGYILSGGSSTGAFWAHQQSMTQRSYLVPTHVNAMDVHKGANESLYHLPSFTGADWGYSMTPQVVAQVFDGTHAGHKAYINKVLQSSTAVLSTDPGTGTTTAPIQLMHFDDAGLVSPGRLVAVGIWNTALSTGNISAASDLITSFFKL